MVRCLCRPGGWVPLLSAGASRPARLLALLLCVALSGCQQIGSLMVLFSPPRIQKAEVELTRGRLAVLIDHARPEQSNPVFDVNLHNRMVEQWREQRVRCQVVPYDEVVRLRSEPDYHQWSAQRVGRALGADQVLWITVDELRLHAAPGDPVVAPQVQARVRLIGVHAPAEHARLWPDGDAERRGRVVSHARQARDADAPDVVDAETAKLAKETAYLIARFFHKYNLEDTPPREP